MSRGNLQNYPKGKNGNKSKFEIIEIYNKK